jgi:cephalosporin hydroxylase
MGAIFLLHSAVVRVSLVKQIRFFCAREDGIVVEKGYAEVIRKHSDGNDDLPPSKRFVSISSRSDCSDIPSEAWKHLAVSGAYAQKWRSLIHNKGPTEIALYQMLFQELRPQTIFEFGALHGGGAVWMADVCKIFEIECRIISVDIDLSILGEIARTHPCVEFIEGDVNNIADILPPKFLSECPHPWLIIEDCHVNTIGILDYFVANGIQAGDYIIVEDTNQDAWEAWRTQWMDEARVERGKMKLVNFRNWLEKRDDFVVDTKYLDQYGFNGSKNWNSIIKAISP